MPFILDPCVCKSRAEQLQLVLARRERYKIQSQGLVYQNKQTGNLHSHICLDWSDICTNKLTSIKKLHFVHLWPISVWKGIDWIRMWWNSHIAKGLISCIESAPPRLKLADQKVGPVPTLDAIARMGVCACVRVWVVGIEISMMVRGWVHVRFKNKNWERVIRCL